MSALSENLLTVNMLLSVFFFSGVQTQCDKTANLNIIAPKNMEALDGPCLLIPCSFREKEKQGEKLDAGRKTFGVWIKSDPVFKDNIQNVIYNCSQLKNSYEMNITGNLREMNCTTEFSNVISSQADIYFFRIENWSFRATARCDPVDITVRDSAWSPRINVSCDAKKKKKKKNSVTVTCSAPTPCPHSPPELTWNLQPDPHRQIEENTDGTFTTKIQQSITLSDTHDGYNIICSVRYPVDGGKHKTAKTEVTLHVSYASKNTSASISPSAGSWVDLNCSSRAKPPISCFTWFQKSKLGAKKVAEGDATLTVSEGEICCCEDSTEGTEISHLQTSVYSVLGVAVPVFLFIVIWFFKLKYSILQQPKTQTTAEADPEIRASRNEGDVHYEDLNFINRPRAAAGEQQEETVYSQINVSKPEQSSALSAVGSEDVYAQVKKH